MCRRKRCLGEHLRRATALAARARWAGRRPRQPPPSCWPPRGRADPPAWRSAPCRRGPGMPAGRRSGGRRGRPTARTAPRCRRAPAGHRRPPARCASAVCRRQEGSPAAATAGSDSSSPQRRWRQRWRPGGAVERPHRDGEALGRGVAAVLGQLRGQRAVHVQPVAPAAAGLAGQRGHVPAAVVQRGGGGDGAGAVVRDVAVCAV